MCCHDKKRLPGPSGGTPCKQRPVLVVAAAPISSSSLLPLPIWQLQLGRQGRRARKSRAARQWCAARSPPARTVRLAPLSAVTDGDHYHLAQTPNGLKNTVVAGRTCIADSADGSRVKTTRSLPVAGLLCFHRRRERRWRRTGSCRAAARLPCQGPLRCR